LTNVSKSCESSQKYLTNVNKSGKSLQKCLANVSESGESMHKCNRDVGDFCECGEYVCTRVIAKVHTCTHDQVCCFMHTKTYFIYIIRPSLHSPNFSNLLNLPKLPKCPKLHLRKYLNCNTLAKLDSSKSQLQRNIRCLANASNCKIHVPVAIA
jgi:hypothetical protein